MRCKRTWEKAFLVLGKKSLAPKGWHHLLHSEWEVQLTVTGPCLLCHFFRFLAGDFYLLPSAGRESDLFFIHSHELSPKLRPHLDRLSQVQSPLGLWTNRIPWLRLQTCLHSPLQGHGKMLPLYQTGISLNWHSLLGFKKETKICSWWRKKRLGIIGVVRRPGTTKTECGVSRCQLTFFLESWSVQVGRVDPVIRPPKLEFPPCHSRDSVFFPSDFSTKFCVASIATISRHQKSRSRRKLRLWGPPWARGRSPTCLGRPLRSDSFSCPISILRLRVQTLKIVFRGKGKSFKETRAIPSTQCAMSRCGTSQTGAPDRSSLLGGGEILGSQPGWQMGKQNKEKRRNKTTTTTSIKRCIPSVDDEGRGNLVHHNLRQHCSGIFFLQEIGNTGWV